MDSQMRLMASLRPLPVSEGFAEGYFTSADQANRLVECKMVDQGGNQHVPRRFLGPTTWFRRHAEILAQARPQSFTL